MPKKRKRQLHIEILIEVKKLLILLIKLPFYLIKTIRQTMLNIKKNSKEKKVKKLRESIQPVYEDFEVLKRVSGNFKKWEKKIMKSDSKIGIIIGARGTGKTAVGMKFLENVYANTKKKCYAMGFQSEDLPSWIRVVDDIGKIKDNAFVLIDEGGVLFSSRKSMSQANLFLSELVLIARHRSLSILFISQNSANLDINIIRQADYLLLKPSSLLQLDFERKKIQEVYKAVLEDFHELKSYKGLTYIYSEDFRGFVNNPLPSFWNIRISRSFK